MFNKLFLILIAEFFILFQNTYSMILYSHSFGEKFHLLTNIINITLNVKSNNFPKNK